MDQAMDNIYNKIKSSWLESYVRVSNELTYVCVRPLNIIYIPIHFKIMFKR